MARVCRRVLLGLQQMHGEHPDVPLHCFVDAFNLRQAASHDADARAEEGGDRALAAREQLFARHKVGLES